MNAIRTTTATRVMASCEWVVMRATLVTSALLAPAAANIVKDNITNAAHRINPR